MKCILLGLLLAILSAVLVSGCGNSFKATATKYYQDSYGNCYFGNRDFGNDKNTFFTWVPCDKLQSVSKEPL